MERESEDTSKTGAYVRVFSDRGRWEAKGIDELSDAELARFADLQPEDGWIWAKFLASWIRDHV